MCDAHIIIRMAEKCKHQEHPAKSVFFQRESICRAWSGVVSSAFVERISFITISSSLKRFFSGLVIFFSGTVKSVSMVVPGTCAFSSSVARRITVSGSPASSATCTPYEWAAIPSITFFKNTIFPSVSNTSKQSFCSRGWVSCANSW